jgi:uncharacterized protein
MYKAEAMMSIRFFYILFSAGCILFCSESALAIDCKKSQNTWENMVCDNKELMALDIDLNDIYHKCIKFLNNPKLIQQEQKKWLIDLTNSTYYELEDR